MSTFVVCFLLCNSPASEFDYADISEHSVCSIFIAYEYGTECSETSAYKIQTPGNYPKENIQHTEHGENLKSRSKIMLLLNPLLYITTFGVQDCTSVIISYHTGRIHIRVTDKRTVSLKRQYMADIGTRQWRLYHQRRRFLSFVFPQLTAVHSTVIPRLTSDPANEFFG